MKPQWYLIHSPNIPENLWLLTEDTGSDKDFRGWIEEDFGQVLTPLGEDLTNVKISVPPDTKFAGILWGDGTHFDEYKGSTWGILGEVERRSSFHGALHCVDGKEIGITFDGDDGFPHVMPPEAFGLKRHAWWNDVFTWCND